MFVSKVTSTIWDHEPLVCVTEAQILMDGLESQIMIPRLESIDYGEWRKGGDLRSIEELGVNVGWLVD